MQRLTAQHLVLAAGKVLATASSGELFSESPASKDAVAQAFDDLEAWTTVAADEILQEADEETLAASSESPFVRHRDKILAGSGTAIRLQNLVLHLYNSTLHSVDLTLLLCAADDIHLSAALEMMRGYAENAENDIEFKALARQILADRGVI